MQRFSVFELDELKLVHRVLHGRLLSEEALMDAEFVHLLQTWLQYRAERMVRTLPTALGSRLNGQLHPSGDGSVQLNTDFASE